MAVESLVLNSTFEPLGFVSARRAVCLVLSGKARPSACPLEGGHRSGVAQSVERVAVNHRLCEGSSPSAGASNHHLYLTGESRRR